MTFDLYIWRAGWFILAQSTEGLKVKVIGQSSRLQEESVAKVVGATWSEGFLVGRPFVKRFAPCYRSVVCLSTCLSVCLSVCL